MNNKYQVGVDVAYKPNWWKRFLVWLGIKKRNWNYSCMAIFKIDKTGVRHIEDIRYFK